MHTKFLGNCTLKVPPELHSGSFVSPLHFSAFIFRLAFEILVETGKIRFGSSMGMRMRMMMVLESWVLFLLSLSVLCRLPDVFGTHFTREGSVLELVAGASSVHFDPTRVTQISWQPRAFIYRGFLTHEECDHLITLAKDKLEKSMVADNESGKSIASEVRTSSGMFLSKKQDEVVTRIEERIAAWTFLPPENGEAMQILHYEHGEKYEPHFDYFHDKVNQELGGHRVATVLMYLSDVQKGGETVFPSSEAGQMKPEGDDWSECAKKGYAVKPRKGDALLFFSLHPDATTDPLSLHGSCPVIEGEKWSATKWIHVRSFDTSSGIKSGACADQNPHCAEWAAAGECKKNPLYMIGTEEVDGYCRLSCGACSTSKLPVSI